MATRDVPVLTVTQLTDHLLPLPLVRVPLTLIPYNQCQTPSRHPVSFPPVSNRTIHAKTLTQIFMSHFGSCLGQTFEADLPWTPGWRLWIRRIHGVPWGQTTVSISHVHIRVGGHNMPMRKWRRSKQARDDPPASRHPIQRSLGHHTGTHKHSRPVNVTRIYPVTLPSIT